MAQAIDIQIQRSLSNTPTNLLFGEPAWDDTNKSFYIGDSTGTPSLINNVVAVNPVIGQVPRWDGAKYTNSLLLNTGTQGCSLLTIDDTGLDWCNYQVGNNGSAFQTLKKSLGTIDVPIPLPSGTKIGGIGFIGFDNATFDPGYVNTEIASVVTEDQNATDGGAELQFKITTNGTKIPITALVIENDGTLSVQNQADYELKVLSDDDIPNKKYVDDSVANNSSGERGFGIYAWSETAPDGTQLGGQAITVTSNATGIYEYVFDTPTSSSNYGVFVQPVYSVDPSNVVEKEVHSKSVSGFTIRLNQQDDGAGTGGNINFRHSVSVLGVGSGLPTGSIAKGTAPDNEFVFFNGDTLNSNSSIIYDTTFNNINIESQNTTGSALNINTSNADSDWLSFTYQSNYVGGFFGVAADDGELGLILGDVGAQNTVIYQGTVNTAVGYQIANVGLSLFHLADTATSTQNPNTGDVLRWNGTQWVEVSPPVPVFEPGILRISSQGADQSTNYNQTSPTPVSLTGPSLTVGQGSTYFTNTNGTITCNFDGIVKMFYHLPHFSNTSRSHLKSYIQKNGVAYGPAAYSYIRVGNGERRDDNNGNELINVNVGDVVRVVAERGEQSTRTGAITLEANCTIILERVE